MANAILNFHFDYWHPSLTLTSWVKEVSPFELAPLFRWWRPRSQSKCADTALSSQKEKQTLQLQRGRHSLFQLEVKLITREQIISCECFVYIITFLSAQKECNPWRAQTLAAVRQRARWPGLKMARGSRRGGRRGAEALVAGQEGVPLESMEENRLFEININSTLLIQTLEFLAWLFKTEVHYN